MTKELPFISCLCPTWRRPQCLENAIACFLSQDYPPERRELVILDDDAAYTNCSQVSDRGVYHISSFASRFPSLTRKYNHLVSITKGSILAVWEDDEIYLPQHLSSHATLLQETGAGLAKCSLVYSTYGRNFQTENATGRFHASLVFTRDACNKVNGWPDTKRADFDQQFIQSFFNNKEITVVDPIVHGMGPTYVFRWESSEAFHGQAFMKSPDDETWYDRALDLVPRPVYPRRLPQPNMDAETRTIYQMTGAI